MDNFKPESVKKYLTEEEKAELATKLAQKIGEKTNKEIEKSRTTETYNDELKEMDAEIKDKAKVINLGYENVMEDCAVEKDFGKFEWVYKDRGGEVRKREQYTGNPAAFGQTQLEDLLEEKKENDKKNEDEEESAESE
jgi:hypothetical protein